MPKLSPLSRNELIKKLREFGFDGPYSGGKHLYMIKGNLRLTVPNPPQERNRRGFIDKDIESSRHSKERMVNKDIIL